MLISTEAPFSILESILINIHFVIINMVPIVIKFKFKIISIKI